MDADARASSELEIRKKGFCGGARHGRVGVETAVSGLISGSMSRRRGECARVEVSHADPRLDAGAGRNLPPLSPLVDRGDRTSLESWIAPPRLLRHVRADHGQLGAGVTGVEPAGAWLAQGGSVTVVGRSRRGLRTAECPVPCPDRGGSSSRRRYTSPSPWTPPTARPGRPSPRSGKTSSPRRQLMAARNPDGAGSGKNDRHACCGPGVPCAV